MKRSPRGLLVAACLAVITANTQAQLFTPESFTGAAIGGIAGGVIGHNHHRQGAEGAAIGAGIGLLLGSLVHEERAARMSYVDPYSADYHLTYQVPRRTYRAHPRRPDYAATGLIVGGLAGGVIGHNHHRQTAEGIAIGAGTGLILGSIAEGLARDRELKEAAGRIRLAEAIARERRDQEAVRAEREQRSVGTGPVVRRVRASAMADANRLFGR